MDFDEQFFKKEPKYFLNKPTMVRKELFKGFYNSRVHNELKFKRMVF